MKGKALKYVLFDYIKYNCLVVYQVPKCYKRDAIFGDLHQSRRISMNITDEVKHIKTTFFKGRLLILLVAGTA